MSCPTCGSDREPVYFEVPERYREYVPESARARVDAELVASICPHCLRLRPRAGDRLSAADSGSCPRSHSHSNHNQNPEDAETDDDFSRVSDAFPAGDAAVPFALLLELCSSLATNRAAIEELLEAVERAGTDPLLAIDRLLADPNVDPTIDLERRRHQLEQLLY